MMESLINKKVQEDFENLVFKYSKLNFDNIEQLNNLLDSFVLELNSYESIPNFILTRALYPTEDNEGFYKGKFVIRPTIKYSLNIKDMKKSFIIIHSKDFFKVFIDNISDWLIDYNLYIKLEFNLNKLNSEVSSIISNSNYPYSVTFNYGDGILDISDNHIELGLNCETILNLNSLGLFSSELYWKNKYIERFITVLKYCNRPFDIVKIKSDITYDLGIYNRKSINKLLRKVVSRHIDFVRVGVGYAEDSSSFAIIEKEAITENESKIYKNNASVCIIDNIPTVQELKSGLTKIVIRYKLMPFEKKTNVLLDIPLMEYLNLTKKKVVK